MGINKIYAENLQISLRKFSNVICNRLIISYELWRWADSKTFILHMIPAGTPYSDYTSLTISAFVIIV